MRRRTYLTTIVGLTVTAGCPTEGCQLFVG